MARHAEAESAVSAVVGAVLLLALFSTAMTIYTVQTLPEWKADKEHNQQLRVQGALGGLRADLDALAARREPGPVTAAIPLETPRVPLLQNTPARATLGLRDGFDVAFTHTTTATVTGCAAAGPCLYLDDGAAVATPGTGVAICAGACIASFDGAVLGITMASAQTGTLATATFTDSSSPARTVTATLSHVASGGACTGELRLTAVLSSPSQTVATPLLCTNSGTVQLGTATAFRVDLLDAGHGVAAMLDRLTAPYSLGLAGGTGVTVGHALVYDDGSGATRATGTGVATATPVPDVDGQRLVYSPSYQSFPSQDLALEGGAVLGLAGETAQAILGDAALQLSVSDGVGSLDWTILDLDGTETVGGGREATVSATFDGIEDVVYRLPSTCSLADACATFTLTTPGAQAWGNFVSLQAGLAGVSDSVGVATDPAAGTTTLRLASGAGLDVTGGWVVHLRIVHATVGVS